MIPTLKRIDPVWPGSEDALLLLGDCLWSSDDFAGAAAVWGGLKGKIDSSLLRERLERCIRQDPGNMEAAKLFGDLCLAEGDRSDYLRQIRRIVQSDPGQVSESFEKVFPLLGEYPDDADLALLLGELSLQDAEIERPLILLRYFIRLAGRESDRAMPLLKALRERDPACFEVPLAMAEAWMALQKKKKCF